MPLSLSARPVRRLVTPALLVLAATGASACRRNQPVPPAPTPTPVAGADADALRRAREAALADSLARARAADSVARAASAGDAAAATAAAEARRVLTTPVYFAFDASELSDETRALLDAKLAVLQRYPQVALRIAGHTDARGAAEYNLALGLRRASAVRKYLADRGIALSRLAVVSFGAERPAASGEGEDAWAQNRRDEFEIVAGDAALGGAR